MHTALNRISHKKHSPECEQSVKTNDLLEILNYQVLKNHA